MDPKRGCKCVCPMKKGVTMRRKNLLTVITMLVFMVSTMFAGSILVVDDDANYNNESRLYAALDNQGIIYSSYDCNAEGGTPDSTTMLAYDLVIWFTGSDGADLYFWDETDSDNTELIGYLNQGGKLWAFGPDILYDRYSGAADTFAVGDFVYDYLGISSYDAQSHTEADAGGVPQLDQTTNVISTIDPILWTVAELWYVDGVSLVDGAVSHYEMGPDSYVYSGLSTVQSYISDDFTVLSSFFKIYNFDSDANRNKWVGDVIEWFNLPEEPVTATILVVDDDNYQNYEYSLYESLERTGYAFDTHDTDSLGSPDAMTLSNYEIVIWYTGNDGGDIYFWDGLEIDNEAIKTYLNSGGRLWINGLDLLYDRFGGAPDAFVSGDFAYDYMGLSSYDAQSRADDGGGGAPLISRLEGSSVSAVDTVTWRFSTAWYIDAVTSNYRSFNDYVMGPADYALAGQTNVCHHIGDDFVVLNSFFNFNHLPNDSIRDVFTNGVIEWFGNIADGNAPTASNLSAPIEDTVFEIFVTDAADVNFVWDASTDAESGVRYRFLLGKSEADIASIIISDQDTPGYTINEHDLYDMIPTYENSVELFWQVLAYDADHNITGSVINSFEVVRDPGPGPSPFALLEPHDGATIRVHDSHVYDVPFIWRASTDPDGLSVSYTLQLMDEGNSVVHTVAVGADSTATVSSTDLLSVLGANPVMALSWIVVASDGEYETNAMSPYKLIVVNALPQAVSILVVDDDKRYNNETKLYTALDNSYFHYDTFDAPTEGRSPTLAELSAYELVIWFTGSDGLGIYFWNANDEDNGVIPQYLDQGGRMWVFGADVLYDRYGSATDYFGPGDMMYDYFGTSAYLAQSWANDDNTGLEMLVKEAGSEVTSLDTIRWGGTSGIVKYADGCALGVGALADLRFGPASYQLAGMANSYHATDGNYITMSTWFNPYYMVSDDDRADWVGDVVSWFENTMVPATLAAPVLTAPAVGSQINLNSREDQFTFTWDTVSSAETVYYQLIVKSNAEGTVPILKTLKGTSVTIEGDDLFKLAGFGTDSLDLIWKVTAQTAMAAYSASAEQSHLFIEGINEAPLASDLLLPMPGDTLTLDAVGQSYAFTWTPAYDSEGDAINYQFIMAAGVGDTLVNMNTADTSISLSTGDILDIMAGNSSVVTFWMVNAQDGEFSVATDPRVLFLENHGVGIAEMEIPESYHLYQNYPNPFNPSTSIRYDLPEAAEVQLIIYDITGRVVQDLQVGSQSAGSYVVQWNGISKNGVQVSTGVYLCSIQTASYSHVIKMLYLK